MVQRGVRAMAQAPAHKGEMNETSYVPVPVRMFLHVACIHPHHPVWLTKTNISLTWWIITFYNVRQHFKMPCRRITCTQTATHGRNPYPHHSSPPLLAAPVLPSRTIRRFTTEITLIINTNAYPMGRIKMFFFLL